MGENATKIGAPDFERLFDFLDDLRASGYTIDTRQVMVLNDLLMVLVAGGETFDDFGRLKTLIAPLICATPAEQEDFYQRFDTFVALNKPRISATTSQSQSISEKLASPKFKNPFVEAGVLLTNWFVKPISEIYTQNQFLTRETTDKIPEIIRFSVDPLLGDLFPKLRILLTAKELRRRKQIVSSEINIDKTIETSIVQNGWTNLVYQYRQVMPEYLVLIDRQSRLDQQTRFADEIFKELIANGVWIHTYYFNSDPRICSASNQKDVPIHLNELLSKHGDCRLIILAGNETFINPVSGDLSNWVQEMFHWEDRTVFLPTLDQGRYPMDLLAQNFAIFPLSLVNLAGYLSFRENEETSKAKGDCNLSVPEPLMTRPLRWVLRNPLPQSEVTEVIVRLRTYLGDTGYHWLTACAFYPELHWEITLYLGNSIKAENGTPVLSTQLLQKLARLPWFRHGYMPDWFRLALIESLESTQSEKVHYAIGELLSTASDQRSRNFELEIANPTRNSFFESLKGLIGQAPDNTLAKDAIFIRFVAGERRRKLAVRINETLRTLLTQAANTANIVPSFNNYWQRVTQTAQITLGNGFNSIRKTIVGGSNRATPLAILKVLDGPSEMIGRELKIFTESVKLGQNPQLADITFYRSDNDSSVSGLHARLDHQDDGWQLTALSQTESRGGIFIDDVPIPFESVRIFNGQKIQMGYLTQQPVVFEFHIVGSEAVNSLENVKDEASALPRKALRVFLSHAVDDKPIVRMLYNSLLAAGAEPWLDIEKLLPGDDWQTEIQKALENTDAIIFCLSKNFVSRDGYYNREIQFALEKSKELPEGSIFFIPVRIEECEIPEQLVVYQAVNLYSENGFEKLVQSLQVHAHQQGYSPLTYPKRLDHSVLERKTKEQIVSILLECESLVSEEKRRLVLKILPRELQSVIIFGGSANAFIYNLVNACFNYRDDGIKKLVLAIELFEGATEPVNRLKQLLTIEGNIQEDQEEFYMPQGRAKMVDHKYEDASVDFTRALELDPRNAEIYSSRGNVYSDMGKYEEALADFTRALELDPRNAETYSSRGNVYAAAGIYEDALADFTRALELDPRNAETYSSRGNVYAAMGKYEDASVDFTLTIELDPPNAEAFSNRGNAYVAIQNYPAALADFTQAAKLDPKYAEVLQGFESVLRTTKYSADERETADKIAREQTKNKITPKNVREEDNSVQSLTAQQVVMVDNKPHKDSILIVDNDPDFLERLKNYLEIEFNVFSANNFESALQMIQRQKPPFQVAIIDLRLSSDDDANDESGLNLLKEIKNRGDNTQTIITTAHPTWSSARKALGEYSAIDYVSKSSPPSGLIESVRKAANRATTIKENDIFSFANSEQDDVLQKDLLQSTAYTNSVDVVILTTLPEEYNAVISQIRNFKISPGSREQPNLYAWRVGRIPSKTRDTAYRVAVGLIGRSGNTNSALAVSDALEHWSPRYVFFVGIASGLNKQERGDLILAEAIYGYEYGKIEKGFIPRGDWSYRLEKRLRNAAIEYGNSKDWRGRISTKPPEPCRTEFTSGIIASGDKTVDNPTNEFFIQIQNSWSRIKAVEMEGAGITTAIEIAKSFDKKVEFLMVRGIADIPNFSGEVDAEISAKDNNYWKNYAASAAASFAIGFISNGLPIPPKR